SGGGDGGGLRRRGGTELLRHQQAPRTTGCQATRFAGWRDSGGQLGGGGSSVQAGGDDRQRGVHAAAGETAGRSVPGNERTVDRLWPLPDRARFLPRVTEGGGRCGRPQRPGAAGAGQRGVPELRAERLGRLRRSGGPEPDRGAAVPGGPATARREGGRVPVRAARLYAPRDGAGGVVGAA